MGDNERFAIALYVPDATAQALKEKPGLRRLILDGAGALDFITPAWWESSRTVRLLVIPETDQNTTGVPPDSD